MSTPIRYRCDEHQLRDLATPCALPHTSPDPNRCAHVDALLGACTLHSAHERRHRYAYTPVQVATEHALRFDVQSVTETDYRIIALYLHRYGWSAATDIYGEQFVRAAMLPQE